MDAANTKHSQEPHHRLGFQELSGRFAVCRLDPAASVPDWALRASTLLAIVRTPDGLSIVCPAESVPAETKAELGWMCLKLIGPFPFSMTGVLASFLLPLSANQIPIFAVSTFDTDYVLIKEESWATALHALQAAGHQLTATPV